MRTAARLVFFLALSLKLTLSMSGEMSVEFKKKKKKNTNRSQDVNHRKLTWPSLIQSSYFLLKLLGCFLRRRGYRRGTKLYPDPALAFQRFQQETELCKA